LSFGLPNLVLLSSHTPTNGKDAIAQGKQHKRTYRNASGQTNATYQ
jgi:hypothetical protein